MSTREQLQKGMTPAQKEASDRFFALRDSGYDGWIGKDGRKANCPCCGKPTCTATLTERCNG